MPPALEAPDLDRLLRERGRSEELGAYVVAAAFSRDGNWAAFALGDGRVVFAPRAAGSFARREVHRGAALALAPDVAGAAFLSGGDDGKLFVVPPEGDVTELLHVPRKWVEHVASHPAGVRAAAVGRAVYLWDGKGALLKTLDHPSAVSGIVFDAKGKRIAASHYNGVSLWFVASQSSQPRRLEWKGSHIAIALSPDGDVIVTAMQENALHGFRLSDGEHMRMSGYPAKTESLSFTHNGKWLATSGAESVVLWPFTGGGPMGKAPLELAGGDGVLCTRVACHPRMNVVAAGFDDGLVVLAEIDGKRILPVAAPGRGAVTALAWSPDGDHLAFGTEGGFAAIVDFTARK
jgi:WD40 repeat protein